MVNIPPAETAIQDFDYYTLCRQPGVEIRIPSCDPGKYCTYITTGTRTVLCQSTGKEYPLERRMQKWNGREQEVVTIHHTDVDVWTTIPESARTPQPDRKSEQPHADTSFYDQARLPTRRDVFAALNFYHGNPDTVHDVCKKSDIFEIYTEEYVSAFARYLAERIDHLRVNGNPVTILEVGAGDGRLTRALRDKLSELHLENVQLIATDTHEWDIQPTAPVEKMKYEEALQTYHPQIVISSWMPSLSDWTAEFRQAPNVQEYLLIGEPDGELCGDPWRTWGKVSRRAYSKTEPPPFQAGNFERVDLQKLSKLQLCRFDLGDVRKSATVSFRRSNRAAAEKAA
ncbi:MAG: hypothetical protein ABIG34_02810 [Candidatus Peregrinibacteria bacterium]